MGVTAYQLFCSMLLEVSRLEYAPTIEAQRKKTDAYWYQVLIGERLPDDRPRKLTPRQHFLRKLLGCALEIDRTNRLLGQLEFYAAHAPRFRGGPSKVSYLNYHVESHLHELYILRERLASFMTLLDRAYRQDRGIKRIGRSTNRVRRAIKRVLGPAVRLRSEHVHVKRLRVPDIERLEFIEDVKRFAPRNLQQKVSRQFESTYRETRRRWVMDMRRVNGACDTLLDFMAANAMSILLRRNLTRFTFPPGLERT